MSDWVSFVVPAVPVAQPRAKATTIGGKARMYTPTTRKTADGERKSNGVAEFKATVRMAAKEYYSGPPLTGPLRVDVTFVFPRHSNKVWKNKPMPRYHHTTKPDRDNLDKMILDSLTGLLWADDKSICQGTITKCHASGNEQPHVEINVSPADG